MCEGAGIGLCSHTHTQYVLYLAGLDYQSEVYMQFQEAEHASVNRVMQCNFILFLVPYIP